jgi:hypothetical protein
VARLLRQLLLFLIVRFRAGGLLEMAWHLFWGTEVQVLMPRKLNLFLKM